MGAGLIALGVAKLSVLDVSTAAMTVFDLVDSDGTVRLMHTTLQPDLHTKTCLTGRPDRCQGRCSSA